jgi:hypothetical protein
MLYTTFNKYGIFTYDKCKYNEIITNIKKSKAYISYINSKENKGEENLKYKKYVYEKEFYYLKKITTTNNNPYSVITYDQEIVDKSNAIKMGDIYGIGNDYILNVTKFDIQNIPSIFDDENLKNLKYVNTENVYLEEHASIDIAQHSGNNIESINRRYLRKSFVMNNHQRFFVIPFLAKYNDKYIEDQIIVNIYDVGIITVQFIFSIEIDKLEQLVGVRKLNNFEFTEVEFYKIKERYKANDFWEKEKRSNIKLEDIIDYYKNLLLTITGVELKWVDDCFHVAWLIADFETNPNKSHKEFVNDNKKSYASILLNSGKEYINRIENDDIEKFLSEASLIQTKEYQYWCRNSAALLSFGNCCVDKRARDTLTNDEKGLKEKGIYEEQVVSIKKQIIDNSIFEFLRFYELSFIKKFFIKKLLNDIANENNISIEKYLSLKNDLDFLLVKYDEENLFISDGSPKKLYVNILDKINTENLLKKAEKAISSLKDDVQQRKELGTKKSETLILIFTSFLTVLLSFGYIKDITENILANLQKLGIEFELLKVIAKHTLRTSVILWFAVMVPMLILIIRRYRSQLK